MMEPGSKARVSGEQKVNDYATMVHTYSHVADQPEMELLSKCLGKADQDVQQAIRLFREALIGDLRFKYCPRTVRDMVCEAQGKPPCPVTSWQERGGLYN